jgi:hypothetical protein
MVFACALSVALGPEFATFYLACLLPDFTCYFSHHTCHFAESYSLQHDTHLLDQKSYQFIAILPARLSSKNFAGQPQSP